MKCKQCGMEFPNLNALTRHKATCGQDEPRIQPDKVDISEEFFDSPDDTSPEIKPIVQNEPQEGSFLIPLSICPDEVKLYALGHTVGLEMQCTLKPEGLYIQEVKLAR